MTIDLLGTFVAGLLTFVSPCILPLIPIYLGLLGGVSASELKGGRRTGRLLASALAFSLGLSAVFVVLGLAATAFGRALVAHRALLLQLGGLVVFLFGLKYLGVLHLPWLEREHRPLAVRRGTAGLAGAFVMGAAFALGWTPCVGPILGSVLTFTASTTTDPLRGALYLSAYAGGLVVPLLIVAAVAPVALRLLQQIQAWMRPMQLATGGILTLVGVLLITDQLAVLTPSARPSAGMLATAAARAPAPEGGAAKVKPPAAEAAACEAIPAGGGGSCQLGPAAGSIEPKPASAGGESAEAKAADEGNAHGAATTAISGPAMLEFVSRSCPICLRMAPVVAAAERGCAGQGVDVLRVEVDNPQGLALARRYGVMGVPTFVFIDGEAKEVARLVGEQSLLTLEQSLQVVSGERCAGFRALPGGAKG